MMSTEEKLQAADALMHDARELTMQLQRCVDIGAEPGTQVDEAIDRILFQVEKLRPVK